MRYVFRTVSIFALTLAVAAPAAAQIDLSGEWAGTFYEDLPHRGGMQLRAAAGVDHRIPGDVVDVAGDHDVGTPEEDKAVAARVRGVPCEPAALGR